MGSRPIRSSSLLQFSPFSSLSPGESKRTVFTPVRRLYSTSSYLSSCCEACIFGHGQEDCSCDPDCTSTKCLNDECCKKKFSAECCKSCITGIGKCTCPAGCVSEMCSYGRLGKCCSGMACKCKPHCSGNVCIKKNCHRCSPAHFDGRFLPPPATTTAAATVADTTCCRACIEGRPDPCCAVCRSGEIIDKRCMCNKTCTSELCKRGKTCCIGHKRECEAEDDDNDGADEDDDEPSSNPYDGYFWCCCCWISEKHAKTKYFREACGCCEGCECAGLDTSIEMMLDAMM